MKNNNIFNLGKDVLQSNVRNGSTLYNANLFVDMNSKEKKSLRIKLRREKDKYISTFVISKNDKAKMDALKKVWFEYSKKVYVDVNKIIDSNSTEQNKKDALNFLNAMNTKTDTKKK